MTTIKLLILSVLGLLLAACAGPNGPTASVSADGPLYYVTDGVTKVIYGEEKGQIACETVAKTGSNLEKNYCYTAEEVIARHYQDAQELERWANKCPSPSLCRR